MFRIGEFSKLTKTTIKTLRYYDESDLFKPDYVDADTGYRYYSADRIDDFARIRELRELGISICDISSVLTKGDLLGVLRARKKEIVAELAETEWQLVQIKKAISLAKGAKKMYTAEITELPRCIVMCRHGVLPSYDDMDRFILSAEAEYQKANPEGAFALPPYCFVEYFSDGYQDKDIEIEYYKAVVSEGKETANIKFRHLEKRKAICVQHKGSFDDIGDAYAYAAKWLDSNGYRLDGNIRERYIDGPWNKSREQDYVTEIQLPVVKRVKDNGKRKLLVEEYKNREVIGGVYAIINTKNGKRLVMSAADIKAAQDRFNFAVATNSSTIYLHIAEDWRAQNGEGFIFEVLATLDKKELSDADYKEALKTLESRYKDTI